MRTIILLVIIAFFCYSCEEAGIIHQLNFDAPAPEQISNVHVTSTPGGAIITYKIPNDINLSYVKAIYEIQPGVFREAKSSYYRDTLDLVGYGDTLTHQASIYSVGRNEKMSQPLIIDIKPLTPPIKSIFDSLFLDATFGGVIVNFKNSSKADLAINLLMMDDSLHVWVPVMSHYTNALEGTFTARGFESEERKFAACVRDRWYNKSDTLIKVLTPWHEELVPKSLFKVLPLEGDFWQPQRASFPLTNLWDDIINVSSNIFYSKDLVTLPQWFTIDLGQTVCFSRMKLHQRTSVVPYHAVWVKSFEIWGTNSYDSDGGWKNWKLLGKFDSRIPSGSVWPDYTAEDVAYQMNGEDFTFIQPQQEVRYIRFKLLDTYGGIGKYQFSELTFWGQIVQ